MASVPTRSPTRKTKSQSRRAGKSLARSQLDLGFGGHENKGPAERQKTSKQSSTHSKTRVRGHADARDRQKDPNAKS